jgi:hypothetical protein
LLHGEADKVHAILNDFDLTVGADVKGMSSKHCMGTKPFMMIDLIHPDLMVHMYRHDLESVFNVLVWITLCFHNKIADPPLQEWADKGGATLLKEKTLSLYPCLLDQQNNSNNLEVR